MKEGEPWVRQQLKELYDERESTVIADMVMEKITGLRRVDRLTKSEEPLLLQQLEELTALVHRLQKSEPVQYILEEAWFRGMKLFVDKQVLIPRPETEELVDWIISDVKRVGIDVFDRGPAEADDTRKLKILDVGTGSGCIALALKKEMPKAEVWGCDVSDEALNVARRNGAQLDIRVDFVGLNFLDDGQTKQLPTVDIIVSNPPYVPQKDMTAMQPNVVQHEPHGALFVPDDNALLFYEALIRFAKDRLYVNGSLYVEIHEELGREVELLLTQEGYTDIEIRKDLQGKDRMVKGIKKE